MYTTHKYMHKLLRLLMYTLTNPDIHSKHKIKTLCDALISKQVEAEVELCHIASRRLKLFADLLQLAPA